MRTLFRGWPIMVNDTHTRRRRSTLRSPYGMTRLSVICVCDVHAAYSEGWNCRQYFCTGQFVLKFWKKIGRDSRWSCQLYGRGYEKLAFFDLFAMPLYFENGTRYGCSYNGRRIWTRMRSVEWCHFQWTWSIPNLTNPDFKVMPVFDAKSLSNSTKLTHNQAYKYRITSKTLHTPYLLV